MPDVPDDVRSLPRVGSGSRRWDRLHHRYGVLLVLLMALVVTFASVGNHELWTPDEPREAQIGREMLASGLSAAPTLSGEPFVEKPPLFPWCVAASYRVFGTSAAAARVPAALFSVLSVLFAFLIARRLAGSLAGLAAAAVLLTMSKFSTTSFNAINDTALTAFVAGGHFFFLVARDRPKHAAALLLAGLCAAGAFMTKGIIGPILVGGPPVVALVLMREWSTLRAIVPRALILCGVPVVAAAGGWMLALANETGWDVVRESVINNTVGRTLGDAGSDFGRFGHSKPPWFYIHAFPTGMLPWSLAIPAVWTSRILDRGTRPARVRFVAAMVLAGILVLSLPAGKRTLYFMPLLPATAAVVGVWVSRIGSRSGGRLDRATLLVLNGLLAAACVGMALLLGWITVRGAPAATFAPIEESALLPAAAALAGLGAVAVVVILRRAWSRCTPAVVRQTLGAGLVAVTLTGLVGRPMLDSAEEMRTGATSTAALVTSSERIYGIGLGEIEQAVLSFYSGRAVTNLARLEQAEALAADGALREFVVEDVKRTASLRRAIEKRFEAVQRIEVKPGDFLIVYSTGGDSE